MLSQLFYISKAAHGLTSADHQQILGSARRNNIKLNITGLLIVKGDYFAQALEGPEDSVMQLFDKIKLDQRHTGVVRLNLQRVATRNFPGWSMGFRDINKLGGSLAEIDLCDPRYVSDPESLSLVFRHFVEKRVG